MKARLPQGYSSKGPGNMQSMIKQAQQMQEEMGKLQEELDEESHEFLQLLLSQFAMALERQRLSDERHQMAVE